MKEQQLTTWTLFCISCRARDNFPTLPPIPPIELNLLRRELESDQHPVAGEIPVRSLVGQERLDLFLAADPAAVVVEGDLGLEHFLGHDVSLGIGHGDEIAWTGHALPVTKATVGDQQELGGHGGSLAPELTDRGQLLDFGAVQHVGEIRAALGAENRYLVQAIHEADHRTNLDPRWAAGTGRQHESGEKRGDKSDAAHGVVRIPDQEGNHIPALPEPQSRALIKTTRARLWTTRGNRDKTDPMTLPALTIRLAAPRGFCAGVDRAIQIVEKCLEKHGAPVYVRHEIVHNRHVVEGLEAKGAIFVEELDEVPGDAPVVFSAHGVPKAVPAEAKRRKMTFVDATCPLVSKVHLGAARHHKADRHVLLIGHEGHPEVVGTMGQLKDGAITLIETVEQARALDLPAGQPLAYITQTTLSVDDTAEIIAVLGARFPKLKGPTKEDICYATTNRQNAVKAIAENCDAMLVLGAPNSSNSKRLVEVAALNGCPDARLIQNAGEVDWDWLKDKKVLGVTAGASAPEVLVRELIEACHDRFNITLEEVEIAREDVRFKLPPALSPE